MPPMRRRLFNICAAVSLVVCILACVIGVVSQWVAMDLFVPSETTRQGFNLRSDDTQLTFTVYTWLDSVPPHASRFNYDSWEAWEEQRWPLLPGRGSIPGEWEWIGFEFHYWPSHDIGRATMTWVSVPYYAMVGAFAFLPLLATASWRQRSQRRVLGHCLTCGYDLTANVSGTCPECGTRIPRTTYAA
jgi:hypothetical protein